MDKEWRVIHRTGGSTLKQLWVRLRSGLWVPTERFMTDAWAMPIIAGGSPGTVDVQVGANGDDGFIYDGTFNNSWNFTNMGDRTGYDTCHSYYRWTGVTILGDPDVAYIQLRLSSSNGIGLMKVYGVDEDNPAAPISTAQFNADPLTDAAVDWDVKFLDLWTESPSLVSIFHELYVSYGPINNKAMMVQVKDDGSPANNYNAAGSHNEDPTHAAKLHVEYEAVGVRRIFITHQ